MQPVLPSPRFPTSGLAVRVHPPPTPQPQGSTLQLASAPLSHCPLLLFLPHILDAKQLVLAGHLASVCFPSFLPPHPLSPHFSASSKCTGLSICQLTDLGPGPFRSGANPWDKQLEAGRTPIRKQRVSTWVFPAPALHTPCPLHFPPRGLGPREGGAAPSRLLPHDSGSPGPVLAAAVERAGSREATPRLQTQHHFSL